MKRLPRNVLILGVVSFFTDVASEMVIPLLPIFLTSVLGATALAVGWIEGLADATASLLKLLSGRWSDRLGRRRPLVIAGYTVSSIVRPFIALAGSAWHVLLVRVVDRLGKGIRTSPRDALLAASTPSELHASAFGLHRAMDHAGAVVGPLCAAGFLAFVSQDLRTLFWLTTIPGAAAVLVLIVAVREAPAASSSSPTPVPSRGLRRLLLPLGLFTLGNASDVFLLLKAGAERAPLTTLPLLWMGLHIVKVLASLVGGRLADRWDRRHTLVVGWLFYAVVYAGFAFADDPLVVVALFLSYGVYHGLTEGAERALVAELVPAVRWGSGFGWYHLTLGALALAASVLFGGLWTHFGSHVAFLTSSALAVLAAIALYAINVRSAGAPAPN